MDKTKKFWIFLSAFGASFALVSWIYESVSQGLFWKGVFALIIGAFLYWLVIKKV